MKRFTQYEISKKEKITFSLVNRTVNWFVQHGYAAKREGEYEITAPAAIFGLFPLYRSLKPYAVFDVNVKRERALGLVKKRGALCLTSALSYHGDYYRDPAVHAYLDDEKIIEELKRMPKGYCRIELYREDLNKDDFEQTKSAKYVSDGGNRQRFPTDLSEGQAEGHGIEKAGKYIVTNKIRTIIDLFCANKAYAAEGLIKTEWA
ncbi:hypothetical protein COV61_04335 [Candidatus Micrarchaeota archaeon CG11_big_fil_rev_8_21_14_0_20_47_5]|nr:MAG: hypothetical protein AUJ17_02600 [Candidatus Micrarchaeota archaeon CG1_02_47_40]PIN83015.1 MAG: hypothetical protein COV61_04335 [Candidatus Micrarchaeota archaeon CG11_big_fil_rev_8_21_14_0_20_47_5]